MRFKLDIWKRERLEGVACRAIDAKGHSTVLDEKEVRRFSEGFTRFTILTETWVVAEIIPYKLLFFEVKLF